MLLPQEARAAPPNIMATKPLSESPAPETLPQRFVWLVSPITLPQKANVGFRSCCASATHIAVSPTFALGASSPIREPGVTLWLPYGPWAGRRSATASYVFDSNVALLRIGRGWVARSLEFNSPDPPSRPRPKGRLVPIPTIAEAEKKDKRTTEDLDAHATPDERHMELDTLADARPLNLGTQASP